MDGNHAHYLNADHNLKNLDFLVLAETKLESNEIEISFEECNFLMGDFNLSHRSMEDQVKLQKVFCLLK